MHLDDIEQESVARVEQYLSKIKVIRKIAGKVIDFLAQLEDFQKKHQFTMTEQIYLMTQVTNGLKFLHAKGIIHADLGAR